MTFKSSDERAKPPSEVSFELFRERVHADKTLPDIVISAIAACANNGILLDAVKKAVGEIDEA